MHAATYKAIFYGNFNEVVLKAQQTYTINPTGIVRATVQLIQKKYNQKYSALLLENIIWKEWKKRRHFVTLQSS
jgi:hypothetical protein